MEDERSKGNSYLMAFIAGKGGAKKVQHEVNLGYQAIVQLEKGKRFGRPDTFLKFYEAYPDKFDIVQANTGIKSSEAGVSDEASTPKETGDLAQVWTELVELRALVNAKNAVIAEQKAEITELKLEVKEWQRAYRQISEYKLGIDVPGVKIGSNGQSTAKKAIKVQELAYLEEQVAKPNPIGF